MQLRDRSQRLCGMAPMVRLSGGMSGKSVRVVTALTPGNAILVGVDRHDPRVGVRAALNFAPQHAGHFHVSAKICTPGDFVDAIGPDRPGPDDLQRLLFEKRHYWASPRMTAAASSTARMILS